MILPNGNSSKRFFNVNNKQEQIEIYASIFIYRS